MIATQSLIDFAIITALEKEAQAVVRRLEDHRIERFEDQDIRTYHLGTVSIHNTSNLYRIAVVLLPSMGEISAATQLQIFSLVGIHAFS